MAVTEKPTGEIQSVILRFKTEEYLGTLEAAKEARADAAAAEQAREEAENAEIHAETAQSRTEEARDVAISARDAAIEAERSAAMVQSATGIAKLEVVNGRLVLKKSRDLDHISFARTEDGRLEVRYGR